jgi:hypothetical protein
VAPQTETDPISARLDVIIRLLLEEQKKDNKQTVGDEVVLLESLGLKGKEVAKILGIDVNQLPSYRRSARKKSKPSVEPPPPSGEEQADDQT